MKSTSDQNPRRAVLHLPAGEPNRKGAVISGILHPGEKQPLTIQTEQKLRPSIAVGVEWNDMLFLGEIIGCMRVSDISWLSEIKVEQVLHGLMNLGSFRRELFGDDKNRPYWQIDLGVYA